MIRPKDLWKHSDMIYYWYTIVKILLLKNFQAPVAFDQPLRRTYSVGLFDCDGLRVMTASKYPVYMDFIRWELIARSKLFKIFLGKGLAPTLGSQKIIYRKPLKIWTKFDVVLHTVGWDDKWIYNVHYFEQHEEVKAVGVTRALAWKRDVPHLLSDMLQEIGATEQKNPPAWVVNLFREDKEIIKNSQNGFHA